MFPVLFVYWFSLFSKGNKFKNPVLRWLISGMGQTLDILFGKP
jgi:hypothetical protein